jgi:S-ribosylhomocysteine lyase LuxS involved in autoinducer biosynthesis
MDKNLEVLIKRVIKDDLGQILAEELKLRFQPIQEQILNIQKGQDGIVEQLREDRKDINQNTIDLATIGKATGVIIENQNHQEAKVVEAVEEATKDIPNQVKKQVHKVMGNESFMDKLIK